MAQGHPSLLLYMRGKLLFVIFRSTAWSWFSHWLLPDILCVTWFLKAEANHSVGLPPLR